MTRHPRHEPRSLQTPLAGAALLGRGGRHRGHAASGCS
jgi:hypothetical protein